MIPNGRIACMRYKHLKEEFPAWDIAYAVDGITYIASIFATDLGMAWESISLLRGWDQDYNKIEQLYQSNGFWYAKLSMFTVYGTQPAIRVRTILGNINAKTKEEAILHIMDIMDWGTLTGGSIQPEA